MADPKVSRFSEDGCTITWDRRYLPLLISHVGGKATMAAINFYFNARNEMLNEEGRAGRKVVIINDMSDWVVPPATVRKELGDRAKGDTTLKMIIRYINVVPSPVLRGVITAISWVTGSDNLQPVQIVSSMDEAIRTAYKTLQDEGVDSFPNIQSYTRPDDKT